MLTIFVLYNNEQNKVSLHIRNSLIARLRGSILTSMSIDRVVSLLKLSSVAIAADACVVRILAEVLGVTVIFAVLSDSMNVLSISVLSF